jgi:hypothetical protein
MRTNREQTSCRNRFLLRPSNAGSMNPDAGPPSASARSIDPGPGGNGFGLAPALPPSPGGR